MEFPSATVTSVKANFATKRITIAFTLAINEDSMEAAEELADYTEKDAGKVDLVFTPRQLPLFTAAARAAAALNANVTKP
jgi:hypothetical protein